MFSTVVVHATSLPHLIYLGTNIPQYREVTGPRLQWHWEGNSAGKWLSCDLMLIFVPSGPARIRYAELISSTGQSLSTLSKKKKTNLLPISQYGRVRTPQANSGLLLLLSPSVDSPTRLVIYRFYTKPDQTTLSAQRRRQRWGQTDRSG